MRRAVFPPGTPGLALDTLARRSLWAAGLDYRHGTGHGVGAALNVHEGPISISKRCRLCSNPPPPPPPSRHAAPMSRSALVCITGRQDRVEACGGRVGGT